MEDPFPPLLTDKQEGKREEDEEGKVRWGEGGDRTRLFLQVGERRKEGSLNILLKKT